MKSSQQPEVKAIISGGGTGGHVFPAIAIADRMRQEWPGAGILFIGARGRMEMEKVPAAGYEIRGLWISGLQRKLTLRNLGFPFKVLRSLCDARRIIRSFNPDVVIGVGGYASGPTLFMASRLGIPTVIQEQNSYPGITNRLLAKRADRICVAYDGLGRFFPGDRIRMTGNPVRDEMVRIAGKEEAALEHFGLKPGMPVLLVIGGSLGARTINRAVGASLERFSKEGIQVIWQTGKGYQQAATEMAHSYGESVKVHAFIREMDLAYAAADVVVSRAGAIAVSELCIVGKPVILVPSPNVAEDHQTRNAKALADKGAAILLPDAVAEEKLAATVTDLFRDARQREELQSNITGFAAHDAAGRILEVIGELIPEIPRKEDPR